MFHSGDDIGAIVADIGSVNTRIGFAGEDTPKAFFSTVRGKNYFFILFILLIYAYFI